MSVFLEPIYQSLSYFAENGAIFTDLFEKLKISGNEQDSSMGNFVEDAKGRLHNMADGSNQVFIGIGDTFSNLASTITVLFYTIQSATL